MAEQAHGPRHDGCDSRIVRVVTKGFQETPARELEDSESPFRRSGTLRRDFPTHPPAIDGSLELARRSHFLAGDHATIWTCQIRRDLHRSTAPILLTAKIDPASRYSGSMP